MKAKRSSRWTGILLACLVLFSLETAADGDDPAAENLTARCSFSSAGISQGKESLLTDGKVKAFFQMTTEDMLTISSDCEMGTLLFRFSQFNPAFLLIERDQNGRLLQMRIMTTDTIVLSVNLKEGCRQTQIKPVGRDLCICETAVYGHGALPGDVPHPGPYLEKTDFLLVATHPDDEWVYLGGVYPTYGGERGYTGTVAYMTLPTWERAHESINGLWIGGVRTHPFFLGFPDVRKNAPQKEKDAVKREDVTLALVRLYRRIRPLVVVTQDPEHGEYGHWQHMLSASAAYDAVQLAADPEYDPDSAAQYGTWTVQKLYQHFSAGMSTLILDVDVPLDSYGGRTALQVANDAFLAHKSQLKTKYRPGAADDTKGDIRRFGLTWSVVGPDTGADLFEHIPEEMLAANQKPMHPTETPAPGPSDEPEATPAPVQSGADRMPEVADPSPSPASEPSATPVTELSAWDGAEKWAGWAAEHSMILSAGIVFLLGLAVALKQYRRSHHSR